MNCKYTLVMAAACPFPFPQGSQVLIRQLSEALVQRGHRVHLLAYHLGKGDPSLPFPVHRIPNLPTYRKFSSGPALQKLFLDFLLSRKIVQVARSFGADLIHAHNYEGALAGVLARRKLGIPVLYHSHNALSEELPGYFRFGFLKKWAFRAARLGDRYLLPRMDFCLAINEELLPFFKEQGVKEERMAFFPPGIFPHEFPRACLEGHGREEAPSLLYLGNLDAYQDLALLFRAFKRVREEKPGTRLIIASHSNPRRCLKLASKEGVEGSLVMEHLSSFSHAVSLMGKAHLAVLPRTGWSGFPIKLLNYMAAGMAVVAFEGSAKCLIHRENGWVARNGDVSAFAKGILQLLNDPDLRERLGKRAMETALSRFSWERLLPRLEEIYGKMLEAFRKTKGD